ncbi:MAG: heme NO-binding domain-containing protein [Clostridia bacterium]|nr:heme NO-binding domain-containing protein [Clostridia bacterium]
MKGVIVLCLQDVVKEKFGENVWKETLIEAGLEPNTRFLPAQDIDDQAIMGVIGSLCKVLNISLQQAADVFGEYWVCTYAPKLYGIYFKKAHSAKELLLNMDKVHEITTKNVKNAKPPRFDYEWENDKTLIMTYKSERGLIDILVGLVKGTGVYYKEALDVKKIADNKVRIVFSN